jgi:hypothetical protein
MEISDNLVKEIAEYIILEHATDVEFLSVWEITEDRVNNEDFVLSMVEIEDIVKLVDQKIRKAEVTITFKD